MSLTAMETSASTKCPVILKTADQYDIWKARVSDACWSATLKDVFTVTDEECKLAIAKLEEKDPKEKHLHEWVGKCWTIITASLHDDVYRKVNHVSRGLLKALITEISHALVVSNLEEVAPLRLELYGATMQKDCGCELQAWVNFIVERAGKLNFLKKPVEEAELVALFLKGLHPVFNQLQVYFAIPGSLPKTFEGAVAITRKFATNPTVAAELAKLHSSGMSQTMFSLTTEQQGVSAPFQKSKQLCKLFASTGTCRYGARCKFVHTSTPAQQGVVSNTSSGGNRPKCNFCSKLGHSEDVCHSKQRLLAELRTKNQQPAMLAAVSSTDVQAIVESKQASASDSETRDDAFYHFVFTVTTPPFSIREQLAVLHFANLTASMCVIAE
jgi:hypothetical protein